MLSVTVPKIVPRKVCAAKEVAKKQINARVILTLINSPLLCDLFEYASGAARRGAAKKLRISRGRKFNCYWREKKQENAGESSQTGFPRMFTGFCYSSRCTVSGEKAGTQTAIYSAPPVSGVEYFTHSPP